MSMSSFSMSDLFVRVQPRWMTLSTQGSRFPQSSSFGSSLCFFSQAIHFVLDFLGSGSVENYKPWLVLKSLAMPSMISREVMLGARRMSSSE